MVFALQWCVAMRRTIQLLSMLVFAGGFSACVMGEDNEYDDDDDDDPLAFVPVAAPVTPPPAGGFTFGSHLVERRRACRSASRVHRR